MKRLLVFCSFFFIAFGVLAQSKHKQTSSVDNKQPIDKIVSDIIKSKTDSDTLKDKSSLHKRLILAKDTLILSDYMMSIDRVNDNLNSISDSSNLGFEVVGMGRRIDGITKDISIIRKNLRGRSSAFNIKNLYLYQSFASELNDDNDRIERHTAKMYHRVNKAKLGLKTVLSDSIFRLLYNNRNLGKAFDRKLVRLERKWDRTDSITKANVDTLNALKVKIADNAVNLSNMLNMMDIRLDRADKQLFGPEVNCLWQKAQKDTIVISSSKAAVTKVGGEKNAIGYYFNQTSRQRVFVVILGILLFSWLFVKRKLLKVIKEPNGSLGFLHLQYLNNYPVLSVLVLLMCLMPFFDAYAPTSYIAIVYLLLLALSSVIFFKKENLIFNISWLTLVLLFITDTLTYLFIEPTFISRLWILAVQAGIIVFSLLFYRKLDKEIPYYKWIRRSVISGMILAGLGIFCNLFGRFSLSVIFGISAIFAVTQAVVLPVFIETVIEIILLQLQGSRLKKGFDTPFDSSIIVKKIKIPLVIVALFLWLIMLTSNLNIYHSITNSLSDFLTNPVSIGSISFKLISIVYFFAIIWLAHILQQLISFLFGETGIENEDITPISKKQHSRLLITRLLVLVGGYLLAIAASGLPIDKLTILLGALGIGIGMGLQNVVNNFVSGIILIFDGSLKIGDEIEVSGQAGKVKEIGLRASTLSTADGADVIIPNGNILSQNIINWTFTNDLKRVMIGFTLSGKELDANVINEVINDTIKNIQGVISHKKPVILYTKVTSENCTLTVRFWSTISNADHAKSEAFIQLSTAFSDKKMLFE
jgi:potassium-dependent mechanosensitive channel